ncbi:MAG: 4-hydroxy-3-methylbut-2-enyl diphosphate reductase [Opitutales bacterium]|nr:4-hydroxy-3-methylbut-2-enyl diphosphate reductase [Opitutales bacterium]
MKVIRSKSAGFCWGVDRAINIARDYAKQKKSVVYTDGPLIHNQQMMTMLEKEGIKEIGDYQSQSELELTEEEKDESVMVVRAHGISPDRRKYLKSLGMEFKDATCPDVGIIAGKIKQHARKGFSTVIFGDPKHPEVIGLMGYSNGKGHVIQSKECIDVLPDLGENVCMVSQSTMFMYEFEELSNYLQEKYPELKIFNTICGATRDRQTGLVNLVKEGAEAIVVIGGHHSANTRKLAKLASLQGKPTFHIETSEDIDIEKLQVYETVGVTAGASTPEFIIDDVCKKLESI